MSITYKSTWHKMRELVILSLNIIYLKDLLQFYERAKFKTSYLELATGPYEVLIKNAQQRKHELNKRVKRLLEDILNSKEPQREIQISLSTKVIAETEYAFYIDVAHACITRKEMERGYALLTNVRNHTYALNLRNGCLLPIDNPELSVSDRNLMSLEYTARHEGPVYKYFEIDLEDPLTNNIRY